MQRELTPERLKFLEQDYKRGFIKFCGFQESKIEAGMFESTIIIGENHKTQDNFIHAGLIATMSDHTAGYAAYTLVPDDVRDTDEKMVSKSTITLMALQAERLATKDR